MNGITGLLVVSIVLGLVIAVLVGIACLIKFAPWYVSALIGLVLVIVGALMYDRNKENNY